MECISTGRHEAQVSQHHVAEVFQEPVPAAAFAHAADTVQAEFNLPKLALMLMTMQNDFTFDARQTCEPR